MDSHEEEEREENKVEEQEEVVISADKGDMLELKPVLNIQSAPSNPTLRPKLLHPQGSKQRLCPSHQTWWH